MNRSYSAIAHGLTSLAVAVAIPAIPCFAYYSLAYVDGAAEPVKLLVMLAGPLTLIGASGLILGLFQARRSKPGLSAAGITLALMTALLLWIRT